MNLVITDSAKQKLVEILAEHSQTAIRFGLKGGGCSGFSYYFSFEEKTDDDFSVALSETDSLIVDHMSAMYLDGAIIDYRKDLMGETFVFINPQVKTQCGCGNSVSF